MKRLGRFLLAVVISLGLHLAASAFFQPQEPVTKIQGGGEVSLSLVGSAFEETLASGERDAEVLETAEPVEEQESLSPSQVDEEVPDLTAEAAPTSVPLPENSPAVTTDEVSVDLPDSPEAPVESVNNVQPVTSQAQETPVNEVDVVESSVVPTMALAQLAPSKVEEADQSVPELEEAVVFDKIAVPVARPRIEPKKKRHKVKTQTRKKAKAKTKVKKKRKKKKAGAGGNAKKTARKSSGGTNNGLRSAEPGNAAVTNYPGKVARKIRRKLRYPRSAQRKGIKGKVVISFVVSANGQARNIRIRKSSGVPVLDEAAVNAVRRAAPFPAIPQAARRKSWPFTVPLVFSRR